ncbi:ABC transporter permease [Mesorhizobium sp. KR9-304]|uniref:ABC transporter permease n=1 Tax=Mesorhizobium sp. KR9-304 TaxID=3156614 RepID=UPI0032B3E721
MTSKTIAFAPAPTRENWRERTSAGRIAAKLLADGWAMAGLTIVVVFLAMAVLAPVLAPYEPTSSFIELRLRGVFTPGHLFGVDTQGRDVLSRVIYGSRVSMVTGLVPVALSAILAIPLGLVAAHFSKSGAAIMRVMDVLFAFPMVLLAILLASILGPGMGNLIAALVIVLLPFNTRVVYVEALGQKNAGYVDAARTLGTPTHRILFREMLPHVASSSIVYSLTIVGTIIVTAAGLSFLGLGVQPPTADWGLMTSEGRSVLYLAPHVASIPGLAIFTLVVGFNLLGDGLREALDPRSRGRS